ncbi:hypothetical protein TEA_026759 [Camellia sinensis var. sinensis]|uniref:Uncharacterized protein n=1 Tax=Camellia sinensis var. sinensis TaxID=542762 RepID=A0A4S4D898_CAMSN|nr:hypothetical protein TEA_026759 [Camellia sinensis var. sinensis]
MVVAQLPSLYVQSATKISIESSKTFNQSPFAAMSSTSSGELRREIEKLEGEVLGLRSAIERHQKDVEELSEEELDRSTLECVRLQERNMALAKELATLKLSCKELTAKCNVLGRGEARALRKFGKAKEKIKRLKIAVEVKNKEVSRALKASKKTILEGDILNDVDYNSNSSSISEDLAVEKNCFSRSEAASNTRSEVHRPCNKNGVLGSKSAFGRMKIGRKQSIVNEFANSPMFTCYVQAMFIPSVEALDTSYFMSRYVRNPEDENVGGGSDFDDMTETCSEAFGLLSFFTQPSNIAKHPSLLFHPIRPSVVASTSNPVVVASTSNPVESIIAIELGNGFGNGDEIRASPSLEMLQSSMRRVRSKEEDSHKDQAPFPLIALVETVTRPSYRLFNAFRAKSSVVEDCEAEKVSVGIKLALFAIEDIGCGSGSGSGSGKGGGVCSGGGLASGSGGRAHKDIIIARIRNVEELLDMFYLQTSIDPLKRQILL